MYDFHNKYIQCKELYTCVKESMDKAASRNSSRVAGKLTAYLLTYTLSIMCQLLSRTGNRDGFFTELIEGDTDLVSVYEVISK